MSKPRAKWETVGAITVDAGLVQLGDPCYQREDFEEHATWIKYLEDNNIFDMDHAVQISHNREGGNLGNYEEYGRAVVVSSGFGDGVYPVEIKKCLETGRVKEVRIKFF